MKTVKIKIMPFGIRIEFHRTGSDLISIEEYDDPALAVKAAASWCDTGVRVTTKIQLWDGEYRVKIYVDGVYQSYLDYFTPEKEDAEITAEAMKKQLLDIMSGNMKD